MPLWYNKRLNLQEGEIRKAMKNSNSNAEAARVMGVHINTYRKYASMYVDEESGKTLYELHKNKSGKGITRTSSTTFKKTDIFEILEGKHPTYSSAKLKSRLLKEGLFPEECCKCGFDERRISDYCVPLIMVHKDGDRTNHLEENIEFVCYNCYFLMYDDVFDRGKAIRFRGY